MKQIEKHKDTKSNAHMKIEQKCQKLKKEFETAQEKVIQAQIHKNTYLEEQYKTELATLEEKMQNAQSLKNITEDGSRKLMELENSLHTSKKQLEKLKRHKRKEEKQKIHYETMIKEEKKKLSNTKSSQNSTDKPNGHLNSSNEKSVVLFESEKINYNMSNEDMEFLRHEIRNLRKTRDYLLEQKCKINVKGSQGKKLLSEVEERQIFQFEEAIEAIDLSIEYKNEVLCGHMPLSEKQLEKMEEKSDRMLIDRLMQLNENEMRVLLHKYFEKVIGIM